MFSVHSTYSTPHSCIEGRASDFMVSDRRRYLCCVLQCAHSVKGGVELHASTGVCVCARVVAVRALLLPCLPAQM